MLSRSNDRYRHAALDAKIEEQITPLLWRWSNWLTSPVSRHRARVIIAEIGIDISRFPTAGIWSPGQVRTRCERVRRQEEGHASTGHGNRYLARALGHAALSASRTDTFFGQRYRRLARRRGKKKAIVAIGRSVLIIIWHLLSNPETRFNDLGSDFYNKRINASRQSATTSPNSKHSATRSPSNPPPDIASALTHNTRRHPPPRASAGGRSS